MPPKVILNRHCLVSWCPNNSTATPDKVFIRVPQDKYRRERWLEVLKRRDLSLNTTFAFVCEDHFELEKDMSNFMKWKLTKGGCRILMNKWVVPHKCLSLSKPINTESQPLPDEPVQSEDATEGQSQDIELSREPQVEAPPELIPSEEEKYEQQLDVKVMTRDVGINTKPSYRSKSTQTSAWMNMICKKCSPIKPSTSTIATSPFKPRRSPRVKRKLLPAFEQPPSEESKSDSSIVSATTIQPSKKTETSSCTTGHSTDGSVDKSAAVHHIVKIIERNPRLYLGVPDKCMFVIELIMKYAIISKTDVYFTLKKIRCDHSFAELGDDFGISESTASRTFSKCVILMSKLLREFIITPTKEQTKRLLPVAFRARYSNVQYIIDCFEVEIQKPTDALNQALTWSEYKKTNTVKYLISSTPDGVVNFISKGFGGRTSDALIIEKSGFLDLIVPGTVVMADRGFKHIEPLLVEKHCVLLRPPSVSAGEKLTKEQVLTTKKIASLRIHIERIIRRVREFKILRPHSCLHNRLVPYLDNITTICCGLINLQEPLIK